MGLSEGPDVFSFSGVVELFMGPHSFGIGEGVLEGFGHCSSGCVSWGCACSGVSCGALIIPPVYALGIGGMVGFECELAGFLDGAIEVLEVVFEVGGCHCELSAWGIMIRMLRLDPSRAWIYHSVTVALAHVIGVEGIGEGRYPGIPLFRVGAIPLGSRGGD